jgi:hypothetical protein
MSAAHKVNLDRETRASPSQWEPPKPVAITAAALRLKTFKPVRWVVPDIIPEGLTILAGKPKGGKSWLMLSTALAVGRGGMTLGKTLSRGTVLYAALEDGERRLKSRMEKVAAGGEWPARLEFWTNMERLENGGLSQLRHWISSADDPRLVIIDTFAKVRSPKGRDESPYEADYRAAGLLKSLADETGVAIILVHHVRKMESDDPMDAVSGTAGLTGAVDTILVLKRTADGVTLFGRGRDIEDLELAVEFERDVCRWRVLGEAADVRRSGERVAILDAMRAEGAPMTPVEVSAVTGRARIAVRRLITKMAADGEVKRLERGKYSLC